MGTDTAALKLLDLLYPAFTKKLYALCIFIDFTKAFDCILHCLLLSKLWRYGIRGKAYELLRSFLTDRKQFVFYENHRSDISSIEIGVPQGSCLGPLLFIIFVNDLCYLLKNECDLVQYADDTALVKSSDDIWQLIVYMNNVLNILYNWCIKNSLCINVDKTKAMIFTLRPYSEIPNVVLNDNIIEYVKTYKYLGINFDNKLNFSCHGNLVCKKLSMLSGVSYFIGPYLNYKSAVCFYYSHVFSLLAYGISVWGGNISRKSMFDLLSRRHKRIVLNIFGKFCNFNYDAICFKFSLLKVYDIYKYFLGVLTYKMINQNLCLDLREYFNNFEVSHTNHSYETRFRNELNLPFPRIDVILNGYVYNSVKVWNNLNDYVKTAPNINLFKKRLKNYFVLNYK